LSDKKEDLEIIESMIKSFVEDAKENVRDFIRHEIDSYKRAMSASQNWCCSNMRRFALKMWGVNSPNENESGFTVDYKINGMSVSYCPFCGAKL